LAQEVHYNFAQGTDFSKYKTYKWVRVPAATYPGDIRDGQIKQPIDSQLAMKGLTRPDSDTADLYMTYQLAINNLTQWNAYGLGGGLNYGRWRGFGMDMGTATVISSAIKVGTLVLDMYDVAAKQQV